MGAIWAVLHLLFQRVGSFISLGATDSVLGAQKAVPSKSHQGGEGGRSRGREHRSHSNHSLGFTPTSYAYWLLTVARDLTSPSLAVVICKMNIMNAGLRCGLNVMTQTSCLEHKESMGAVGEEGRGRHPSLPSFSPSQYNFLGTHSVL